MITRYWISSHSTRLNHKLNICGSVESILLLTNLRRMLFEVVDVFFLRLVTKNDRNNHVNVW